MVRIPFTGVKKLRSSDFKNFAEIVIRAYPGMLPERFSQEDKASWIDRMQTVQEENMKINYWGYFKNDALIGGMILYDYKMSLFNISIDVGGVGLVCVDLLRKKEHTAKRLIEFFHQYYLDRGFVLTCLWPFRSDFYEKMGYAIGKKMNQYRFRPTQIRLSSQEPVSYLENKDIPELCGFFNAIASNTHGMIHREEAQFNKLFRDKLVVGYQRNGRIEGYINFSFKKLNPDNFVQNAIEIMEFIYSTPQALRALLTFLRKQDDQIDQIVFNTPEDSFHLVLTDSRLENPSMFLTAQASNLQGVGVMYRILNLKKFFERLKDRNFGGETIRVRISISDTFLPENSDPFVLSFKDGHVSILSENENFDVELITDVAMLTSMVLGVTSFKTLHSYGFIHASNSQYIEEMDRVFRTEKQPITIEQF
ncbi:MAG: enhanced intracellular survival protein Eis [Candidatus Heimdallarchaeota archaeon]